VNPAPALTSRVTFGTTEQVWLRMADLRLQPTPGGVTLRRALQLHALGLSVIPLKPNSKMPDLDSWEQFQTTRPTEDDLRVWFGNGELRNIGIVLGRVSGVAVIESDTPKAESWCKDNLDATPMQTRSARGVHRYYRRPPMAEVIPSKIRTTSGLEIEVKRDGQYVVGPGSVHPSGHIYTEIGTWPTTLNDLPLLPVDLMFGEAGSTSTKRAEPLPQTLSQGSRNDLLFREGCKLRRLGWDAEEIATALKGVNDQRCDPPLGASEVEGIARSCCRYQPAQDTFPTTEAGDAEFFASCFADHVRYDHRRGRWLLFTDHRWAPQTNGEIHRLALDAVRARQRANIGDAARVRWAVGGEARKRLTNLLALAQNIPPLADVGDSWDLDPWLLGVENGVIDLRTGQLRAGRSEDRITMCVRVPYHPDATSPLWDQTISEIFGGDAELIAYFDRATGYSLTGDCSEEVLIFCWGGGANGKGTLMNTFGWVLGDYADDLPFSALEMHDRKSGIPNDIAKIVNKRFVTASETGDTNRLNEARIKSLTGRDPITARFLHEEFFTFRPNAKFWLATNKKPIVRDTSTGFWRRIHLVPFTRSFEQNPDKTLKDRLIEESAGILTRAVRGCLAWQRTGLVPPAVVREATKSYRADNLPLVDFIDARCVREPKARATFGALFDAYLRWCNDVRESHRLTRPQFRDALRELFAVDETSKRNVTFIGIGLQDTKHSDEATNGSLEL